MNHWVNVNVKQQWWQNTTLSYTTSNRDTTRITTSPFDNRESFNIPIQQQELYAFHRHTGQILTWVDKNLQHFVVGNLVTTAVTHTRLTALCPGLPGWAGTRKVKPIWILLKQETVSGSSNSWAICKSAPRTRQITTPAPPPLSFFYRPDALPAAQPTVSKHWRHPQPSLVQ